MTQKERLLKYLEDHGSISTFEAYEYLKITKVSNRISELINEGHKFTKKMIYTKDIYGNPSHHMLYSKEV